MKNALFSGTVSAILSLSWLFIAAFLLLLLFWALLMILFLCNCCHFAMLVSVFHIVLFSLGK